MRRKTTFQTTHSIVYFYLPAPAICGEPKQFCSARRVTNTFGKCVFFRAIFDIKQIARDKTKSHKITLTRDVFRQSFCRWKSIRPRRGSAGGLYTNKKSKNRDKSFRKQCFQEKSKTENENRELIYQDSS